MPFPAIPVLIGLGVYLFAKGSSKTSSSSSSSDFYMMGANGVLQVRPDKLPALLGWLNAYHISQLPQDSETSSYGGAKDRISTTEGGEAAPVAIGRAAAMGQHTLLSTVNEPAIWFVPAGAERLVANRWPANGGRWALLVEGVPQTGSVVVPPVPTPGAPFPNVPLPNVPLPGIPNGGPTAPASTTNFPAGPTQNPDGSWSWGGVTIPPLNIPGMPGGTNGQPMPLPNLPGLPGGPMAPNGQPPIPLGGTHTIRDGDIPSRLAQWYAGDGLRWQELATANPDLVVINPDLKPRSQFGGPAFSFAQGRIGSGQGWTIGRVLVLPPGWDASKGISPRKQALPANVRQALTKAGVQA